jgi:hypothetical protein
MAKPTNEDPKPDPLAKMSPAERTTHKLLEGIARNKEARKAQQKPKPPDKKP